MMKKNLAIWMPFGILLLAFILRLGVLIQHGLDFILASDDMGYVSSAKRLLIHGQLTYHFPDVPTAHLMPGEPFLLAFIFSLFGLDTGLWVAKVIHILIGCATIFVAMKLAAHWVGQRWSWLVGIIAAIFPPFIQVDNLYLTEGVYTFATLLLIYGSIKLAHHQTDKWLYFVMASYFLALYFRVNIALYPIALFVYLIVKRYPWKIYRRHLVMSVVALLIVMGPWWIRNALVFDDFIPLTAGSGDPLLLGTFQGEGYPRGSYDEFKAIGNARVADETDIIARMHERSIEAKKRMAQWWEDDPQSMLKSYLWLKPIIYLESVFYWKPVYDIPESIVVIWYRVLLALGILGWLTMAFTKKYRAEFLLIAIYVAINIALNSYYFAFPRYNYPLVMLWIIGTVFLVSMIVRKLKRGRNDEESSTRYYSSV